MGGVESGLLGGRPSRERRCSCPRLRVTRPGGSGGRHKAPVGPIRLRRYTVPEVTEMLGYGPTKVRMLAITGDLVRRVSESASDLTFFYERRSRQMT